MRRIRLAAVVSSLVLVAAVAACTDSEPTTPTDQDEAVAGAEEAGAEEAEEEEAAEEGWSEELEEQAEERGAEIPEDAYLFRRLMTAGRVTTSELAAAGRAASTIEALASPDARLAGGHRWVFRGPRTVGGRVVDAAVDPTRSDTVFVATSTNGVWKTTDAGDTFTNVWPDDRTHSMGAIAVTPDGTLFAGTGETNPGGGSITYGGDGIYRSTDSGASWQRVGLTDSGTIGRIVVDPADPQRIWVAVSGNLFVPGGQRGVYLSEDGGDTWQRSLTPPNSTTGAVDVAVDPEDSDHLLAAQWDHIRRPDARVYTGVGSGVWETRDGGQSWQRLGAEEGLLAPADNVGRIGVAFAPSDSARAYVVYANNEFGAFQDFFRSDDNGATWTRPAGTSELEDSQSVYGWWFARIYVDPDDADRLYLLGLDMWHSRDAAESFEPITEMHVDQHVVAWDERVPDRIYVGNDGGFWVSEEDAAEGSFTQGDDQPWSQYANVDVAEQDISRFAGGLQDNGTRASWTDPPFEAIFGGDGQRALIDPTDPENYYACAQYGFCFGFQGEEEYSLDVESSRFPYFMQLEFQPTNSNVMYAGGDQLNQSTDEGRTWAPITGDLGKGEAGTEPNPLYRNHYGTISALAVSRSDPDTIWVGTDNGYLYRSTDGGTSFTELPNPVRPKLWISRITIDPRDARTVYLTFSGFREGDNAPYVLRTTNGGQTWRNITANLPHAPVNDLQVMKNRLYVATDVGVFTSSAQRPRWFAYGSGMPQLVVTDLRYVPREKLMFAATFGMGVWSTKA